VAVAHTQMSWSCFLTGEKLRGGTSSLHSIG
jgi:hypothetical protein